LFCFLQIAANGQGIVQNDFEHSVKIFDQNGKSFVNPYVDIAGNPFFLEELRLGEIRLKDQSVYRDVPVRLDLVSQEVHFIQNGRTEMFLPAGLVSMLVLRDSTGVAPVTYIFQSGFPPIDNQSALNFYQVLSDGKIRLLKSLRKVIHQEKNEYTGETQREFREYEEYYFFTDNRMEKIKRDKSFILDMMKDKSQQIEDYLQKNKISFRSMEDLRKLVDYYNSLHP